MTTLATAPDLRPRRIGYVLKVFPRLSETFIFNEIRALESLGEEPTILALHHPDLPARHAILRELRCPVVYIEDEPPATEERIPAARRQVQRALRAPDSLRDALLPRKYMRLALALADRVEALGIGHLHAHFASRAAHVAMLAAALSGTSYSFTAHAKDIFHHGVDPDLLRLKLARARFVVTVTDFNCRHLRSLVADIAGASGRITRLYNGVDLERFRPAVVAPSRPLVLGVGRLVEKKGFGVLVQACALLRRRGVDFDCEIVGGGDQEEALRRAIDANALGDRVRLLGPRTSEQVAELMQNASVFALPCVVGGDGNVDALPTVLLEAMACALPVVSTSISGIPEMVDAGETGLLVPPGDATRLADALAALLTDRSTARRLGEAGRVRAARVFDLQVNVARLLRLLRGEEELR